MFGPREHETIFLHALRLVARSASVICIAVILLFFIGEGINFGNVAAKEWVGLLFFPVGVFVGLVLAWREEILGGAVTIASVVGFYLVYGLLLSGTIRQGWLFLLFLVPGVLSVLYGAFSVMTLHHGKDTVRT